MIKITALNKFYKSKRRSICHALKNINLTLPDAGLVFVLGKSGSGKSTLLNLIGGLDNISSGSIEVDGNDLAGFKEKDFCNYRNTHIGFIFQDYHLIDELTVYENIVLSLNLRRIEDRDLVKAALCKVDLAGYEDRYPTELSGGEQQRVAIARAIVKNPRIILADEPTGNLDTHTSTAIITLLKQLSKECLILIVSHNVNDANNYADRIIELAKGEIISDKSRNPDFADQVTLDGDRLVYPEGLTLKDRDIEFINNNLTKFSKRTDKFIVTPEINTKTNKIKIERKSLSVGNELKLFGSFLKNKTLAISLSAFMVAVIMTILALAQTIVAFDGGHIIAEELDKLGASSLFMTKSLTEEQKAHLSTLSGISTCYPEIYESDIEAFKSAGYTGIIYEVLKYNLHISLSNVSAAESTTVFSNSPYLLESLGTIIVDEDFLVDRFGSLTYLAKADEFHPTGVIIPDYIADAIILCGRVDYAQDYESLIGEYRWGGKDNMYSFATRGYINGIFDTGYKEKYSDLLNFFEENPDTTFAELGENEIFVAYIQDIYTGLGFCYSLNPNFCEDAMTNPAWEMLWHYTLTFNDATYYSNHSPQVRNGSLYGLELGDNEIMMSVEKYNDVFGTEYNSKNINEFIPHTTNLKHYKNFVTDKNDYLFSMEVKIVGLYVDGANKMCGTFVVGDGVYDAFAKDYFYTTGLLFDGNDSIDKCFDVAEELGFEQRVAAVEGIHSMTAAVDVFVPIFEFISIFLYIGVIFILINFSTKTINDKMHEIGIMKALGTKNSSVGVIFGLQIMLIALLTCGLSTLGYYLFIDVANDILIESVRRIAPSWPMMDLQFLIFKPIIALQNCMLTFSLALLSLIAPMIKIKAIKPVKIIKTKE